MELLRNKRLDSDEFILQISHVVETVVGKYVARKAVPRREQEDVAMVVLEKFIHQKDKIMGAFQGKSALNTYYVAVLNRMVCEVIRKESRHWYAVIENEYEISENRITFEFEAEKSLIIKNEVIRYQQSIQFFNRTGAKVNLFLKYYFGLPLQPSDYKRYGIKHAHELQQILPGGESVSKGLAFDQLAKAVNLVEGKNLKGDAVRMWLNKQMDVILERLNTTGGSQHNRDNLAILCELSALNYSNYTN